MRILLAFDKFKHALGAAGACAAAARGARGAVPDAVIDEAPLADGGEGFAEILTRAAEGELRARTVAGPRFAPVEARYGVVDIAKIPEVARARMEIPAAGKLAIIEMAQASGLDLLAETERDPWQASSFGTGELIGEAANAGVRAILLGVGGSATNDLGLGALEAAGLEFRGADGAALARVTPAKFADVARLAGEPWPHIPDLRIACDVRNPLLGPNGATAVFGPQKGLAPGDFAKLERAVGGMAKKICAHFEQPRTLMMEHGAGAAGGIAFGLRAACAARIVPGFALIGDWLRIEERVRAANVVVTGEGRFDASSLGGKGPGAVADIAIRHGKKLIVLAGSVDESAAATLRARAPEGRVLVMELTASNEPRATALRETAARIEEKLGAVL